MDGQKQNRLSLKMHQLTEWMHGHKPATILITLAVLIIGSAVTVGALFYEPPVTQQASVKKDEEGLPIPAPVYYSPLSGERVDSEAAINRQVTAIMIENSPAARPQSGMLEADVIYEAVAEGGITRFLALYQTGQPDLIGPVRSLRPYFVAWLAPYDASVIHVGGSKRALDEVRDGSYKDADQFFNPGAYYRSQDRYAPHNVYTTFDRLNKLNKAKGFTSSKFEGFARKPDTPAVKPNAKQITVDISSGLYNSSYAYDAGSNQYVRSQGGEKHIDRESKKPLKPDVVVIMEVSMNLAMEDGLREQIKTTGSGVAYIFQDGTVQKVTWHKASQKAPLTFIDKNKKKVKINTGQTWIAAIPGEGSVTWK